MVEGPEWFAPKRFGYGASFPIAWQGWAVLVTYLAVVAAAGKFLSASPLALAGVVVPATVLLFIITARTTRGGWHWRWGWKKEDDK